MVRSDGKVWLQRRDAGAPSNAGKLTLFGGHIEEDETPDVCLKRELAEETSLRVIDLAIRHLFDCEVLIGHDNVRLYVFEVMVPDEPFEVFEGAGAEVFTAAVALARSDVAPADKIVLRRYAGKKTLALP